MITNVNSTELSDSVKPINLRERFGRRYKIDFDPAYYTEYGRHSRVDDPWYQIILCHHGEILPWGGDLLAASTFCRGAIANRLSKLDCCEVIQDGSDGVTVTFHIDDFRKVADLIKPRGKRTLTPVQRDAFIESGQPHRYPNQSGQNTISGGENVASSAQASSISQNPN